MNVVCFERVPQGNSLPWFIFKYMVKIEGCYLKINTFVKKNLIKFLVFIIFVLRGMIIDLAVRELGTYLNELVKKKQRKFVLNCVSTKKTDFANALLFLVFSA